MAYIFTNILQNAKKELSERARIHSLGLSVTPWVVNFHRTNAQLDLTKRKMSSNGSVNVKHSEIIIKKDSRYVCQQLVVRAFSYLNCFKKLESICCPSYEMNAGSWVLIT